MKSPRQKKNLTSRRVPEVCLKCGEKESRSFSCGEKRSLKDGSCRFCNDLDIVVGMMAGLNLNEGTEVKSC